jgi:ABC-type glycerol-3-phosphate transport system permease component
MEMTAQKQIRRIGKLRLNRSAGGDVGVYIFLTVLGFFMILPLVYAVITSFKPFEELWIFPPRFFRVDNPTMRNYQELFRVLTNATVPFSRYLFNTALVSVVGTTGHVMIASMAAFMFAKHTFPGSKVMFTVIVTALMFNAAVTVIPNFLIMSRIGFIDTYFALIIPAFGGPLGLYLMKQFIEQMIDDAMLEAARIDGAGEPHIFWNIVMPIVKPAWLTLIIFSFRDLWNIGGTAFIHSEPLKTLNYAMGQIMAGGYARAGVGAAAAVIMLIMPITAFVLAQSQVVETMGSSGMKG